MMLRNTMHMDTGVRFTTCRMKYGMEYGMEYGMKMHYKMQDLT